MPPSTNISSSWYHSALRISVLVFALMLVFESGIINSATRSIAHTAGQQFATVIESTAGVEEMNLQIETQMDESMVTTDTAVSESMNKSTFMLSIVVFILLLLIVLNYILDHLRHKERQRIIS